MPHLPDIFRWLIDTTGACTALLLIACAVIPRIRQPARRLRAAELALAGCLVVAILQAAPATRFSLALVDTGAPVQLPWYDDAHPSHASLVAGGGDRAAPVVPVAARFAPLPAARQLAGRVLIHWREILVSLYIAGVLLMIARLGAACLALRSLARRCEPPAPRIAALWQNLTGNCRRPIRLAMSSQVSRPITFGLWHPIVLLPDSLCGASQRDLHAVLHHELGHIERRDAAAWMLAALANVLLFFLPPLWILQRHMRLAQEFLADSLAADSAGGAVPYAEMMLRLVALAQQSASRRTSRVAGSLTLGAWRAPSDLMLRIRHLFSQRDPLDRRCPRRWTLAAAACVLALTTMLGAMTLADNSLRASVRHHELRGVVFLLASQKSSGGWLTDIGPAPTALVVRSLLQSGVPADHPAIVRARRYVDGCLQSDGGYYTDGEPTYHTAVVLSMYAAFTDSAAHARLLAGRRFLESQLARPTRAAGAWYHGAASSAKPSLAPAIFADPTERAADAILDTYGSLSYDRWKSLVYAGLTESDPRVQQATRWLSQNWTLDQHPGTHSAEGLYYYYLAAAKTLHAANLQTLTDRNRQVHPWREELQRRLIADQASDGSWTNTQSSRWLESRPEIVTAYALLALQESRK